MEEVINIIKSLYNKIHSILTGPIDTTKKDKLGYFYSPLHVRHSILLDGNILLIELNMDMDFDYKRYRYRYNEIIKYIGKMLRESTNKKYSIDDIKNSIMIELVCIANSNMLHAINIYIHTDTLDHYTDKIDSFFKTNHDHSRNYISSYRFYKLRRE